MTDLAWFLMICAPLSILAALVAIGVTEYPVRKARREAWAEEVDSVMGSALGMSVEEFREWCDQEENR